MKGITRFFQLATLVSAIAFTASVLFQIYARFFLSSAPAWTEEASRFFFVYAMSFAAGLAVKDHEYVFLDVFYAKLSPRYQKVVNATVSMLTMLLFVILGVYALAFVRLGLNEKSSSITISMAWAFASIFIMALSITLFSTTEFITQISGKK